MLAYLAFAFLIGNGTMLLFAVDRILIFTGKPGFGMTGPFWLLILVVMNFATPITHFALKMVLYEVLIIAFGLAVFMLYYYLARRQR